MLVCAMVEALRLGGGSFFLSVLASLCLFCVIGTVSNISGGHLEHPLFSNFSPWRCWWLLPCVCLGQPLPNLRNWQSL